MAYGEIKWSRDRDPICLESNIAKTAGDAMEIQSLII